MLPGHTRRHIYQQTVCGLQHLVNCTGSPQDNQWQTIISFLVFLISHPVFSGPWYNTLLYLDMVIVLPLPMLPSGPSSLRRPMTHLDADIIHSFTLTRSLSYPSPCYHQGPAIFAVPWLTLRGWVNMTFSCGRKVTNSTCTNRMKTKSPTAPVPTQC